MKLFVKLIIVFLFLAMMAPFTILKGPDGNTLMSFSDIGMPDLSFDVPDIPDLSFGSGTATLQAGDVNPEADTDLRGKDVFYQWYDSAGNVQFTTVPPEEGIPYTIKGYDPDANVIQAVKLPEKKEPETSAPAKNELDKEGGIGNPYEQESIQKLIEDTKNVEKMLKQRFQEQDALLNQ